MRYLIHAAPPRMWYVEEFLIPSMLAQGIPEREIEVWNDSEGKGCLLSCMENFRSFKGQHGGTWHLQDDVILSRDFASRTITHDTGIVCGFGCQNFGPSMQERGKQPARFMWWSFQCIRIPNELAAACADWFFDIAANRAQNRTLIAEKKHDDQFWRAFILEQHPELWVENLAPNLVDHVDFLIGGTLVNKARMLKVNRSALWEDEDLVEALAEKLREREKNTCTFPS